MDLSLFSNYFSHHIPQSVCEVNGGLLNLANNRLEGELPQCFEPRRVNTLILSNNMLSGNLQTILDAYTELYILDLAWNNFTGIIPEAIAKFTRLSHLNLAGNSISGALPQNWSTLMGMHQGVFQDMADNNANMSVTMKGQERYYYDLATYDMVSIDLSSNYLTGGIPEELASLGGVINLNLSRNHLTGKIPAMIGVMRSLESLDLSENNLYGELPQSLSNLAYLSYLDLSYNNLTGTIPSGVQLDTIYAQNPFMYDGNNDLCGHPLQKNCFQINEPNNGDHKRDELDSNVLSFFFGLCVGFVFGVWVVVCFMLFNESCRVSYILIFDTRHEYDGLSHVPYQ